MKAMVIAKRVAGRICQVEITLLADEKVEYVDGVDYQTELGQLEKLVANVQQSEGILIASPSEDVMWSEGEIVVNQVAVDVRGE